MFRKTTNYFVNQENSVDVLNFWCFRVQIYLIQYIIGLLNLYLLLNFFFIRPRLNLLTVIVYRFQNCLIKKCHWMIFPKHILRNGTREFEVFIVPFNGKNQLPP